MLMKIFRTNLRTECLIIRDRRSVLLWADVSGSRQEGWCCIFVQIGCSRVPGLLTWKSALLVRLTAWARKIQTTDPTLLCLPSRPNTDTFRGSKTTGHWDCQRNRLSFQPWDLNNLYYNDNSFKMKFTVRINLIPTKPKIVTADWEFMNLEFLLCRQW